MGENSQGGLMKQTPQEEKIIERMQPGNLTLKGFLGKDDRTLNDIILCDEKVVSGLGKTPEEIADRMQYFTDKAFEVYDAEVIIEEKYRIEFNSIRGKLICPFGHADGYAKGEIIFTNIQEKRTIQWTPLSIHLIGKHHFFEGHGSEHRLEPELLIKLLF